MATVQCWTGAETKALRQAMRLSIRAFAVYLGIDARTVNKWEARHTTITLRPHTQALMDTALQRAPEEVKTRFAQIVRSTQQEQHRNTVQPAAPAERDSQTGSVPGADSLTPLPGNNNTNSLLTELVHNPGIISQMSYSGDERIAEYSEERPESSQSHPGDFAAGSPSLTQLGPSVSDVATMFAMNLALFIAAIQSINEEKGYNELLTSVRRLVDRLNRRDLFQLFGLTATTAFASSWLDGLDRDEQERMTAAIMKPERIDSQVITHIEIGPFQCSSQQRQAGSAGGATHVLAQQKILQAMTADCPDALRPRLLSVLGHSLRSAGWIFFNAGDYSATRRYYEQARVIAHDAQDLELTAMVLANLSHAADSSGTPAIAVDYAVAAQTWAERAHNPCVIAFASDIGACAFAAKGDYNATMRHLDSTQAYLPECSGQSSPTFYTYSEGLHVARQGKCLFKLGRTTDAVQVIGESLKLYSAEPSNSPSHMYRNITSRWPSWILV
jgi:transcriptional regulator with XRE-family HTH domain